MRSSAFVILVLGLGACGSDNGPNGPSAIVGAIGVSAGSKGTCAVGGSGGLACWGALPDGTTGDTTSSGPDILGAVSVTMPIDLIALSLSKFGENSGCAAGSDHLTYCWGHLDAGPADSRDLGPGIQALTGASSVRLVTAGRTAVCVTRTDNLVRCYGGFVGGGRGTDSVDVSDAGPVFSLTATGLSPTLSAIATSEGDRFGCALRTDSLIACWGMRSLGQLGGAVGDSVQDCGSWSSAWCQPGPALIAGGQKYSQVSVGIDHACATRNSGGVDCWGRKLGAPLTGDHCTTAADCVNTPTAVALPGTAVRVVVGAGHACALLTTGAVYCWGDNTYGQLGRPGAASETPVQVSGGYTFVTISAGADHTCALEAGSGAVGCWGRNDFGQLGDGTTTDRDHPVAVVAAE